MVIVGLADSLDANASVLAACRCVRPTDDLPLAGLIDEPVADPKLHPQDAARGGCARSRFFSGHGLAIQSHAPVVRRVALQAHEGNIR